MRALLPIAVVGALTVASPILAQSVGMPPNPDINTTGFSGDKNALPDAVTAIESAINGGRVVEIRYNNVSGVPGYDVVLARGGKVNFVRFSKPGGGIVTLSGANQPTWMLKWPSRTNVTLAQKAKVPLSDAIRTAEASMQGAPPAVAAGIARSASNPDSDVHAYNVALLRGTELRRVAVDSNTGLVIQDPQALGSW
jgi:hypothetical protein